MFDTLSQRKKMDGPNSSGNMARLAIFSGRMEFR
jgi:hypothetical protein